MTEALYFGDCLTELDNVARGSVDTVYIDPPFFSQTIHTSSTRDGTKKFSFSDVWKDNRSYADFLFERLMKVREKMKPSGSLFFHCDKSASHISRLVLESVFGQENFQSEIIWNFRRWSNSKKGLLNNHQTIYFFSKSDEFKFFPIFESYSPSTNIDQIMQKRTRDERNKSVYARENDGGVISNGQKKGVPLSDVWDIPFLNPKAKERTGYPTQKPVLLLKRIIELTTEPGDIILDPFCGSGTTLVAAKLMGRSAIGIDNSQDAISLVKERLEQPIETKSALLEKGRSSYENHDEDAAIHLSGLDYIPVHRNKGIDGLLKNGIGGLPTFIRVQREHETQSEAAGTLVKATRNKGVCYLVLVVTRADLLKCGDYHDVIFLNSMAMELSQLEERLAALDAIPLKSGLR